MLLAGVGLSAISTPAWATDSESAPTAKKSTERLLVIAPAKFLSALDNFMRHKSKLLDARVVSLEDALAASVGVDDAEKLKRYLFDQWKSPGVDYVLLVGDVDTMPVRYMTLDRHTPAAFNYSFYPSDLYYSDLAKADGSFEDWNAKRDDFHVGYYGEVRGETNKDDPINFDNIDYQPDVAVGRWPVSTTEEVELIADKTIRYEQQVIADDNPHLRRAGLVAVGGWVDTRRWMDERAAKFGDGWEIEKRYFSNRRSRSDTPPPNREEVRGLFNRGTGLILHTGHGQPGEWEQCFRLSDLDNIENSKHLAVVVSAGCSTANFAPLPPYGAYIDVDGVEHKGTDNGQTFDSPPPPPANYQTGKINSSGLGEQILKRNEHGAVAYVGCNTGSQPCGLTLVGGLIDSMADSESPRLGKCWSEAIAHYYKAERLATLKPTESWYPPSIFFQPMKFMLFGDPSLRLPSQK